MIMILNNKRERDNDGENKRTAERIVMMIMMMIVTCVKLMIVKVSKNGDAGGSK